MEKRNLVCIVCPVGCRMEAELEEGSVGKVTGNTCKRGIEYAQKECVNPTRIITTTVAVTNGKKSVVPVKTQGEIPKGLIMQCMQVIRRARLQAPVVQGQVVLRNILGTGVNIITTGSVAGNGGEENLP